MTQIVFLSLINLLLLKPATLLAWCSFPGHEAFPPKVCHHISPLGANLNTGNMCVTLSLMLNWMCMSLFYIGTSCCRQTWEACRWSEGSERKDKMVSTNSNGRQTMLGLPSPSSSLLEVSIEKPTMYMPQTQLNCAYGQTCCHLSRSPCQLAFFQRKKVNFHFVRKEKMIFIYQFHTA